MDEKRVPPSEIQPGDIVKFLFDYGPVVGVSHQYSVIAVYFENAAVAFTPNCTLSVLRESSTT